MVSLSMAKKGIEILNDRQRIETNRAYEDRFLLVSDDVQAFLHLIAKSLDLPVVFLSFLNASEEVIVSAIGLEPKHLPAQQGLCLSTFAKGKLTAWALTTPSSAVTGYAPTEAGRSLKMIHSLPLANKKAQWIACLQTGTWEEKKLSASQKKLLLLFGEELNRKLESSLKTKGPKSSVKRLLEKQFAKLSYYQAAIINGTDYAVIYTGTSGIIKTFNAGATNMLGYTEEEVVDVLSPTVFHDTTELQAKKKQLLDQGFLVGEQDFDVLVSKAATGQSDVGDWTYLRKDGSRLIVQLSVNAIFNEQRTIIGYLAIAEDITQRKKIQEELRLSEEKHRLFFENSQGLMCTHDDHGRFLSINSAGANLIGYTPEEMIGMSLYDVTPHNLKGRVDRYLSTILNTGSATGLMKIIHKNGSIKVWFFKNIRIHEASASYVIGNAIDVSSRVELEKNLKFAKILAEKNALAKDQFLANMSHEIRTPMNAIVGFTDVLSGTALSDEQMEYLNAIRTAGENLLGIINDILDFSKIESGKLRLEKIPFNLRETARSVYEILAVKAREKKLSFNLDLDARLPEFLTGDRLRVNQILFNLVGNAIKFTEQGEVNLVIRHLGEQDGFHEVEFEVKDTGIGIPPDKLDSVFDRFSQASSDTTRKYGGTGLGLSISKSLIQFQGGRLEVQSEIGKGSSFKFILPFEKHSHHHASKHIHYRKEYNHALPQLSILLVEDNDLNQKLAKKVLGDFGFRIDLAGNGKEAIQKLETNRYDLVLMDLQMPEMDGYQATQHIREVMNLELPIIAMTAHSLVGEKEKCLRVGMNDYMAKPFKAEELYYKIRQIFNTASPAGRAENNGVSDEEFGTELNLDSIRELSGGNLTFEKEIIELAAKLVRDESERFKEALDKEDHDTIRRIAHKLKSNMALFKLTDLVNLLETLQNSKELTTSMKILCLEALSEFQGILTQLKQTLQTSAYQTIS